VRNNTAVLLYLYYLASLQEDARGKSSMFCAPFAGGQTSGEGSPCQKTALDIVGFVTTVVDNN